MTRLTLATLIVIGCIVGLILTSVPDTRWKEAVAWALVVLLAAGALWVIAWAGRAA